MGGHTLAVEMCALSSFVDHVVPVSSTEAAEMVKLLENIHRSINIGLVNELKIVADAMGLDIFEVIDAAKPVSLVSQPITWFGSGDTIIDPFYLTWVGIRAVIICLSNWQARSTPLCRNMSLKRLSGHSILWVRL